MALVVAMFFAALELVTHKMLFPLSRDLHRFEDYPVRAAALMVAPPPRVAFLGNSLTDRGIDAQLFARELGVSADAFVADTSHINTWIWMMKAEFWKRHLSPDLLIVHFYTNSLDDGRRLEIGRLAQFFTDRSDWPEVFAKDLPGLGQRVEFVIASQWATFAVRERIKERVLDLIPGYEPYLQLENAINFEHDRAQEPAPPRTRTRLARFLALARQNRTRVLFVAFPTLPQVPGQLVPYEVLPDTIAQIRDAGMSYLDLRVVPELDRSRHYADDIHLNEEGRTIYTRRLAAEVRELGLLGH